MNSSGELHYQLSVFSELRASHALEGHPVPHFHLWKIAVELRVPHPLDGDRVLDLVFLEEVLGEILAPLRNVHLNRCAEFGLSPTSENLCLWLWERWNERLPGSPLHSITTELCDAEGRAAGKARLGR